MMFGFPGMPATLQPRYFRGIPIEQLTPAYIRWLADAPIYDTGIVGLAGFGPTNMEAVYGRAPLDQHGRIK